MTRAIMTVLHPHLTSAYKVRRLRITLPLVPQLLDGVRYYPPGDVPPLDGQDLRAFSRPKIGRIVRPIKPDRSAERRHREQRELKKLAEMLGDPV